MSRYPVGVMASGPAFLFDLDGTLVDSVYQHVLAWQDALDRMGIELAVWRIHRKIGMSGGLFANALLRETGRAVTTEEADRLRRYHGEAYAARAEGVRPLPGARELLAYLTEIAVPWAIATSGYIESAGPTIEALGVPQDVPVITRDQVAHAKPDPDLFLAAADRLGVDILESIVVGDSVWDLLAARRARALGVGLLSGGYGQVELERAGAYRVYEEPADLLRHLDEVGVRARTLRSRTPERKRRGAHPVGSPSIGAASVRRLRARPRRRRGRRPRSSEARSCRPGARAPRSPRPAPRRRPAHGSPTG